MQNQQLFEAPFVSEVGTEHRPKGIRLGSGKCMCKRCQRTALPSLTARAYSKPNHEVQWLFELPYTNQEDYDSHSEADAMFGWAKQKWEQWRKGKANPLSSSPSLSSSAAPDVSTLVRQLDHDPNPNRSLTKEERYALTQVVTSLISRSILKKKQEIQHPASSPDRKRDLRNNLTRLVNLGRFRFLKQLPKLRNSLIQALDGTDVKFPH